MKCQSKTEPRLVFFFVSAVFRDTTSLPLCPTLLCLCLSPLMWRSILTHNLTMYTILLQNELYCDYLCVICFFIHLLAVFSPPSQDEREQLIKIHFYLCIKVSCPYILYITNWNIKVYYIYSKINWSQCCLDKSYNCTANINVMILKTK